MLHRLTVHHILNSRCISSICSSPCVVKSSFDTLNWQFDKKRCQSDSRLTIILIELFAWLMLHILNIKRQCKQDT